MTAAAVLAIDQGTTNTKALLLDESGAVVARAARGMTLDYPFPGWAEQSATVIWESVVGTIGDIMDAAPGHHVAALAISNQRETVVLWDAASGRPLAPAVSWQCRRSAERCEALRAAGHGDRIVHLSGLALDPLFPAGKIARLLDTVKNGRARAERGELRIGTVDTWLLWNLTGGDVYATEPGNASRTQLFNIHTCRWDSVLAGLFDVPLNLLPTLLPSDSRFGVTAGGATRLPAGVPIHAMMGDSHAALFGHGVRLPGPVKATIGTGSSIMTLTPGPTVSRHGLSSSIAWSAGEAMYYALEGNITVSGNAVSFITRLLGLRDENALSSLARTVDSSDGVVFVPALAGLGAPHWRDAARGLIDGLTLGSKPAHVARATLEAVALQIADVVDAMEADLAAPITDLLVDGGATRNAFLLEQLALLSGRRVRRNSLPEASAIGVAQMAAQAIGWSALPLGVAQNDDIFQPSTMAGERESVRSSWRSSIRRVTHGL